MEYDKAISLKINRVTAVEFTNAQLKDTGKLHMLEALIGADIYTDDRTRWEYDIDRDNPDYDMSTLVNVRCYKE